MSNKNKKGGDTITSNLDRIRAFDDAYNNRDWEVYESLIDKSFCNRIMGSTKQQDKAELVRAVQGFCAKSPDNQVHNAPYIVALSDGEWTCTIARLTGTMKDRLFESSFPTIARWIGGKIVEQSLLVIHSHLREAHQGSSGSKSHSSTSSSISYLSSICPEIWPVVMLPIVIRLKY